MPNQIYSLNPSTIIVTSSFEENVKKLESVCIPSKHIIDIYIESQKYAQNIRDMTNPMRFIEARESKGEFSDIRFRQLERAYNDVVRSWSKLKPLSFIQQYEAYVAKRPNNTGIENGIASEIFFRFTYKQNKTLIVDPTPSFIKQQEQYGNQLTYTYSDDRYSQMCQYTKERDNIKDICCMDEQSFDRVLYFARDSTPEQIQKVLEDIRPTLVEQSSTNIYILMPTGYLEKRHSKGELWQYLTENYTVHKIVLMPQDAVNEKNKKQCLLILQNKPTTNCKEIFVQKTKLTNRNEIEALEFRRIPYTSFADRDRTLSEMYNTDYTDYSEPNRRKKPVEYQFTKEITIWVSITQKDEKYRPYYSLYDYPNSDQMRKNTLLRGKPIKTHIPGKWYDSKEEALASAEYVLNDKELAKKIRKAVKKEYMDKGKPVSLKTLLFMKLESLSNIKGFNAELCNSIFFRPHSATTPVCGFTPCMDDISEITSALYNYIQDNCLSATNATLFMRQIVMIFDYAVIEQFYEQNPARKLLDGQESSHKQTSKLRRVLVGRSFSVKEESAFLALLMNDKKNPEKALALLFRYYTGLSLNQLCALTRGDYIIDLDLDLAMIVVTKEFRYRTMEVVPLPKEKQRLVPVVRPIAEMMSKMFSTQGRRSPKAPLFAKPGKETEPLTPRQLRDYYNSIADRLGIPEIKLSVDVENSSQATTDISDYQGDFLRCNFDFHARYDTKLETESINYLMGRKLETTEGQYYCDYRAKLMQLLMRAQLDQWAARYFAPPPVSGVTRILPQKEMLSHTIAPSNQPVRTRIELDIDPSGGGNIDGILLQIFARYGGSFSVHFYPEEETKDV